MGAGARTSVSLDSYATDEELVVCVVCLLLLSPKEMFVSDCKFYNKERSADIDQAEESFKNIYSLLVLDSQ